MKKIIPIAALMLPAISFAQGIQKAPDVTINASWVVGLFCAALVWMFWGLLVLGVAMFFVGGYIYATSNGEPERVGKATKTLTYAAIAVAVAIIAYGVPNIIGRFLGAGSIHACESVSSSVTFPSA